MHNNVETFTNRHSTGDNTVSSPLVLYYTFHAWQTYSHQLIGWDNSIILIASLGYRVAMQRWHVVSPPRPPAWRQAGCVIPVIHRTLTVERSPLSALVTKLRFQLA